MAQREYTAEFRFDAKKSGGFSSTLQSAQKELAQFQKEYRELSKVQGDIAAYQKQQTAIQNTEAKLRNLQQQYDNIQREIQQTEGFSSDLENKLISKQEQIDRTTHSLQNQIDRLNKYGEALHEAGLDTENLTDAEQKLSSQMDAAKQKIADAGTKVEELGQKSENAFESIESAMAAAGIVRGLKEIYDWYGACANAAIEYESSVTGVYKTVDGTQAQLAKISDGIRDMTTEIPATTTEISAVAEAAGQLGIATDDVLEFTRVMIDLGNSTNLTADDAASSLAKLSNITGTAATDYSRLGSVVVGLGNNFATTEADIVAMSTRLASSGTLAGLTEPEIMALATAMSSVGIEADAGGTAMTQTLSAIEKAVATGGDDLQKFADIAGMSAQEFASTWNDQPIMAIQAFISGLGALDQQGESAVLVLDELGLSGVRQSNMLKSLGLASGTLSSAVGLANTAWKENVALTDEANKRYATTASQQAMMQNAYNNLRIELGDNFTPVLKKIYQISSQLFSGLSEFVKQNPAATKAITAIVIGATSFTAVLSAYVVLAKLAKIATEALTASMKANPYLMLGAAITGVVTAIIALGAANASTKKESEELTATAQLQSQEIQELQSEYDAVCSAMGDTSAEALELKYELDKTTEAFENSRETQEEYLKQRSEVLDAYKEQASAYADTVAGIDQEWEGTQNLISRLTELTEAEYQSAAAKQEILAIVDILNERIPELGLNYDMLTGKLNMTPADVMNAARADLDTNRREADYSSLKTAMEEESALQQQYEKDYEQQKAAYENLQRKKKELASIKAWQKSDSGDGANWYVNPKTGGIVSEYDRSELIGVAMGEVSAAEKEWAAAKTLADESKVAWDDNIATQQELANSLATAEESADEMGTSTSMLNAYTDDLTSSMSKLAAVYTEAYNAAYESVTGQYALWDEADDIVATSASSINAALESQIEHWQTYNANLADLGDRAADIEGLNEMLASFADGSAESVNAVAGMAKASDDDLRQMVANWQALQKEQDATATNLAEVKTGLTEVTEEMLQKYTDAIRDMDLSDEAKESATSTIQSFVEAADEMLPQVQAAYERLGNAALSAMGQGTSYTVSGTNTSARTKGQAKATPYATGTTYATDAFIAGEEGPELVLGHRGASVFPAQETQRIMDAIPNSGNGGGTQITFAPVYHLEGVSNATDLEAALRNHDAEMREYIQQVVADAEADAARRRY